MGVFDKLRGILGKLFDVITNRFGIDVRKNKVLSLSLSRRMSEMFESTSVNVYVVNSRVPSCFTLPSSKYYNHPEVFERIRSIRIVGPILSEMGIAIENLSEFAEKNVKSMEVRVDEKTKKISIPIEIVNVYITTAYLVVLQFEEISAILMHEIGSNLAVGLKFLVSAGTLTASAVPFIQVGRIVRMLYKSFSDPGSVNKTKFFLVSLCVTLTGALIIYLTHYFKKRQDSKSDAFLEKIGYLQHYQSALRKTEKYSRMLRSKNSDDASVIATIEKVSKTIMGDVESLESMIGSGKSKVNL